MGLLNVLRSLRHNYRALRSISFYDRSILLEAWVMLCFFDISLRLGGFDRIRLIAKRSRLLTKLHDDQTDRQRLARRINWLVAVASRWHIKPMTCLRQSLTLQWMLSRRGIDSKLRLGVNRSEDFEAHAWLEYDGHQPEMVRRQQNSYYLLPITENI